MIVPTNGRVVWYQPATNDMDIRQHDLTKPLTAHICHVWGDRMVNLDVIDSDGRHWPRTSVTLLQDDDLKPEHGQSFAVWMPYQVGQAQAQAKKQEEKKEMMTDEKKDEMINNLTAPKVTLNGIKDKIAQAVFLNVGLLTIAVLKLQNGFYVVGKSACASPENYNQDIGVKLAHDDAVRQIWALEGYLLKESLSQQQATAEAYMMATLDRVEAAHGTVG